MRFRFLSVINPEEVSEFGCAESPRTQCLLRRTKHLGLKLLSGENNAPFQMKGVRNVSFYDQHSFGE